MKASRPCDSQIITILMVIIVSIFACTWIPVAPTTVIKPVPDHPTNQVIKPSTQTPLTLRETENPDNATEGTSDIQSNVQNTLTFTNTVSSTTQPEYGDHYSLVALAYLDPAEIVLLSLPDGFVLRRIRIDSTNDAPVSIAWRQDNCHLVLHTSTGREHRLIDIGLDGDIAREYFREAPDPTGALKSAPVLSPNGKYVSYIVFSGEQGYETSEHQNIEYYPVDTPDEVVRVTQNGGAWAYNIAWSPDSTSLAYSDYDEKGVLQSYIMNVESGSHLQLDHFSEAGYASGPMKWSSSGDRLAIVLYGNTPDSSRRGELRVWKSDQGRMERIKLPENIWRITDMYWSDDGRILVLNASAHEGTNQSGIYWIDADRSEVVSTLTDEELIHLGLRVDGIERVFPITLDLRIVGIKSGRRFISYDYPDRKSVTLNYTEDLGVQLQGLSLLMPESDACNSLR